MNAAKQAIADTVAIALTVSVDDAERAARDATLGARFAGPPLTHAARVVEAFAEFRRSIEAQRAGRALDADEGPY